MKNVAAEYVMLAVLSDHAERGTERQWGPPSPFNSSKISFLWALEKGAIGPWWLVPTSLVVLKLRFGVSPLSSDGIHQSRIIGVTYLAKLAMVGSCPGRELRDSKLDLSQLLVLCELNCLDIYCSVPRWISLLLWWEYLYCWYSVQGCLQEIKVYWVGNTNAILR